MAEKVQYIATGRRKNSIARVRLMAGEGKITVNDRPFNAYFPRESNRLIIMQPLETAKRQTNVDIFINVNGGGLSGQAGAVKHGIARALVKMDATLKAEIKKAGFLTRDSRKRERKKYGRKRARRRFQFTKR
ncbi:MAG: 30S ribosomal protein S9 [Candidatus Omnitrophota bacterium]|nr:30S ribosomal protein S9 [Candidatus Omnitrophota bacterium]